MPINKVIYGDTPIMDLTDSTLENSDQLVSGVTAYDRSGTKLTGTANYMDLVSNPVVDDILVTDATGQAVDSGVSINDVVQVTDIATENDLGLVKLNPSESITLNGNNQLDVGGRLGQFTGTTGVFNPKTITPAMVKDGSFLLTEASGTSLGSKSLAVCTGSTFPLKIAASAGATRYEVANTYVNRILCANLVGGVAALNETSAATRVVNIVSVQINGADFTPDSSANDTTNNIIITTDESVNPDSSLAAGTNVRMYYDEGTGFSNLFVGQAVGGKGGASVIVGQRVYAKSGNACALIGADIFNQGNGNAILGRQIISRKNRWFMSGTGHDNTNGRSEAGVALGQWSNITANTVLAVGNGTNQTNRSNTFEILTDGRVKSSGTPTDNDDLTTKAYVDSAIGGGGLEITTYGNADFTYQQEIDPDTQEVINECVAYSTVAGNVNEPKAVKYGRVVNMSGAFKNINVRPSNAPFVMGKVPSGCEPLYNQYIMQQGSTQYKYLLQIQTDGTMICQRYSASTSAIAVTNNAWLNINATYISAS